MGAVWRGTDHTLNRPVALKQIGLLPGVTAPDSERAEREARLAARLSHPNLVAVFDLVTDESGQRWMVMEYVEGNNLSQLIRARGPIPPDHAAAILGQVASALSAAHTAGIVHRDVKPSNILLSSDGTAKLSDFGIARGTSDVTLTVTGLVTGSPAYLAPEVATGAAATAASDVWSLGASLCHAVTGSPPYEQADNVMATLYSVVNDDPPRPEQAGWLAPILAATMVKDPTQRWDINRVRDALVAGPDRVATTRMGPTTPAPTTAPPMAPPRARPPAPPPRPTTAPRTVTTPPTVLDRSGPGLRLAAWSAAALAVLMVAIVAISFGLNRDGGTPESAAKPGGPTTSQSSAGSGEPVTKSQIETFVADYLDLAPRDPEQAFALLTPAFQAASGGLEGYQGFWGRVANTKLESVRADPEGLRVSYTYTYTLRGEGRTTQTVSLLLERGPDGALLIAGEG
jgi:serine/threonine protein kinase